MLHKLDNCIDKVKSGVLVRTSTSTLSKDGIKQLQVILFMVYSDCKRNEQAILLQYVREAN